MTADDLHFGANLTLEVGETARQARWMEELGYEYFSAGEHFMRGDPPGPSHASLPVLAVAAGATQSIRLLSSIVLLPFYHPLMLARMTATLDAASNGRLTPGRGHRRRVPGGVRELWPSCEPARTARRRVPRGFAPPVERGAGILLPAGTSS